MENALTDLPFDISLAGTSDPTQSEVTILAAISDALRSHETETELASAQSLENLCPPISSNHDIEAYLWELWTILIGVARCIPHDAERPGQGTIVGILSRLRECDRGTVQIWGRELKLWQDLPLFSQRMADTWSGLLVENNTVTEESASAWRNQNAFAARCLEAGIAGWDDYATRQLRAALEDRNTADQRAGEFQILAATEWVIHSSRTLLRWSKEDEDGDSCDDDVKPGELFDGKPGLSTKRWDFWKSRLEEIYQKEALYSKEVQIAARRAVEEMDKAESPAVPA